MLNVISTLAQAQHGLGVQDKKSVWNIKNFPLQNNTEDAGVPQVIVTFWSFYFSKLVFFDILIHLILWQMYHI